MQSGPRSDYNHEKFLVCRVCSFEEIKETMLACGDLTVILFNDFCSFTRTRKLQACNILCILKPGYFRYIAFDFSPTISKLISSMATV